MAIADDGDLIKGLGYIVLYAAYVEERIDECVTILGSIDEKFSDQLRRRPTSQKLKYIYSQLGKLAPLSPECVRYEDALKASGELLEERNTFIHSRIYAIKGVGDIRKPGREEHSEQPAMSVDFYDLANRLFSILGQLDHGCRFALKRQIGARTQARR